MVKFMLRPRCGRKICVVTIIILPLYFIWFLKQRADRNRCVAHLDLLCEQHRDGIAFGNMCSRVCSSDQYDVTCLQEATLIDYQSIGKWVLQFKHKLTSEKFILKTESSRNKLAFESLQTIKSLLTFTDSTTFHSHIRESFNARSSKTKFDTFYKHLRLPEHLTNSEEVLLMLLKLMEQDELMNLYKYDQLAYVMRLYGVCGDHYAVEYLQSAPLYMSSWRSRLKLALSYLSLIERMDNFQDQLQLCDVKTPNYGQRITGEVVLIDVDTTFYEHELQQILGNSTCSVVEDTECNFWDCIGVCDVKNKQCKSIHLNANLQAVCNKIFSGSRLDFSTGLLIPPFFHSWPEITRLLDICLKPRYLLPADELLNQLRAAILTQLNEE